MDTVLEKYFNKKNFLLAWERVNRWSDRTIKDHYGLSIYRNNLDTAIDILIDKLFNKQYVPVRPQKFFVPKASRMQRTKTMLVIDDALVFQAIANIIAAENYDKLAINNSFVFGSVLCDEVKLGTAIFEMEGEKNFFFFKHYQGLYKKFAESVNKAIIVDKVKLKFETDITGFFDSIPHYNLLNKLSHEFGVEDEILDILGDCFNCWSGTKNSVTPGVGIPQGVQPSFFFANLLLHELDNLIIGDSLMYYRYMDDIRIYEYSEEKLQRVLVIIDNLLKGYALSLNTKKTSIEPVKNDETDSSIIHIDLSSLSPEDDNEVNWVVSSEIEQTLKTVLIQNKTEKNSEFENLAEQDNNSIDIVNLQSITEQAKIIEFWQKEYNQAIIDIENSCILKDNELIINKQNIKEDRDLLSLSFRFRHSLKQLKHNEINIELEEKYLKNWFLFIKAYPHRTDHFCWALMEYGNNHEIKSGLLELLKAYDYYEWIVHTIYMTLSVSQEFAKQELQKFNRDLEELESDYAKKSLYKLLLYHCNDKQLFTSVLKKLEKEQNQYLKNEIFYYALSKQRKQFTMSELLNSFGL
ncbi:MAG: hypothetical protein JXR68_11535 [Bacteroidales bacterium]|nr:hypothetical protein [Bacteroidales bacterium]